jgi:uncharacterized protein YkwD
MTDSPSGMEGSNHRIRNVFRMAVLAGVIAVAGCGGGGGGSDSADVAAPVSKSSAAADKIVSAEGTLGLVGPAGRATAVKKQFEDETGKIAPNSNRKPGAGKKGGVGAGDSCNDRAIEPSDGNISQLNAAILCLVNGERADRGLAALNHVSELDKSSEGMCSRMVAEHFFSHETPDGKTVVDRVEPTGYIPKSGDWVVGENLAWGSGALSTPQSIVNGWMNSPGHRANILAPDYKDIGLAACMGSPTTTNSGGTVYVNNFGAKAGADLNATLPGKGATVASTDSGESGGDNGSGTDGGQTVAGQQQKAKKRAACARKAKKAKSSKARRAALKRCKKR